MYLFILKNTFYANYAIYLQGNLFSKLLLINALLIFISFIFLFVENKGTDDLGSSCFQFETTSDTFK